MTRSDNAMATAQRPPAGGGRPVRRSAERIVEANGVDLCVQTFGDAADPAILLIAGAAGSMDWWEDPFCEQLAAGGRYVIRYDHRDTGRSVTYEPGAPPYTFRDLVADAVGLLDVLDLVTAHVVGISMGGGIAQLIALDHPNRVATLTLISTSPAGPHAPDLPPMSDELSAYYAEATAAPDWSDRSSVIDHLVDSARPLAGSLPFDEDGVRAIAARMFDRSSKIAATANQFVIDDGDDWRPRLGAVRARTLVLHGTEDPLFPYGHAIALADEIPSADIVPLARAGHELPRTMWDVVIPAILQHTSDG